MAVTTGTVITREEFPILVREEFKRLLGDSPSIKYQLTGMMVESFAQKTDLQAILERIDAQGERIDTLGKRIKALREDFNRQFADHSRRMDELRQDFNRGFALLSTRVDTLSTNVDTLSTDVNKVDSRLGAIGARWGRELVV